MMPRIADILRPGIKLVRHYGPEYVREEAIERFEHYSGHRPCGDFITFLQQYGYVELDIPAVMDGRGTDLFFGLSMPEESIELHEQYYAGTALDGCVPVAQGGGAELYVWASLNGKEGIHLCSCPPFLSPSKYHYLGDSLVELLSSEDSAQRLNNIPGVIFAFD